MIRARLAAAAVAALLATAASAAAEPSVQDAPVLGFQENVPLDQALSAIIPKGQPWRWEPGTNRSELVSWYGGKPWRKVLHEMLDAHGLAAIEGPDGRIAISLKPHEAPLSQAAAQILPANVHWKAAAGVDPETSVTWTPGPPWNKVLDKALQGAGLAANWNDPRNLIITLAPQSAQLQDALKRILPAGRHYRLAQGVDPRTPLSWTPGQDWHGGLAQALDRAGLESHESNGVIEIALKTENAALAKAVSSIVPSDTVLSMDRGVDTAAPVAWTPGPDWRIVLAKAIAPLGLTYEEGPGKALRIREGARESTINDALKQIIPQGARWTVAPSVNPATRLRWTPAADWRAALQTALAKARLEATDESNGAILVHPALQRTTLAELLDRTLPTGYRYSLASGVNGAAPITWQPQGDWRATLAKALEDNGLAAVYRLGRIDVGLKPDTAALADALPQILPSGYTWTLDPGVSPSTLLTWSRGASWRNALDAALAKLDLTVMAAGPRSVRIGKRLPGLPFAGAAAADAREAAQEPGAWTARKGDTLRGTLTEWATQAGKAGQAWDVQWTAATDYPLRASATFTGSFQDAVRRLFDALRAAIPAPHAEIHDGNHQIVVTTDQEDDS